MIYKDEERENADYIIAAEYQVLKLFIDNPSHPFMEGISVSSFPHRKARVFYKAIIILQDNKETITEGSLFREANKLDSSIDISTTRTLLTYVVDETNIKKAVEELDEGSIKYKMELQIKKIQDKLSSPDPLDHSFISGLLYQSQDLLSTGSHKTKTKTIIDCLNDYEEELLLRKLGKYYPFFDTFLDRTLTKKAAPGQVVLIAGSTGTGKSAYGLNLINGFINNEQPCMYFSPEMDEVSTMDRFLSMRTEIPISEWYTTGSNIDPLIEVVKKEKKELNNKPFSFIDEPSIGLDEIQNLIREFKMKYRTDYACIFVDLITQIKEFIDIKSAKGNLATVIELAVNRLHGMSKKENVCFVCIAQMNREADSLRIDDIDSIEKLRPTINHIKNSNALGERSRTVLSVFRRKYYAMRLFPHDENVELMPDTLEIQVLKQSMGRVGVVGSYMFNGPTFSIIEMQPEEISGNTEEEENPI